MASICGEGCDCKVQLKGRFKVMPDNPIEILGARERRRRWSMEEKLRLVAECEEPGAVLRVVAARHDTRERTSETDRSYPDPTTGQQVTTDQLVTSNARVPA